MVERLHGCQQGKGRGKGLKQRTTSLLDTVNAAECNGTELCKSGEMANVIAIDYCHQPVLRTVNS